MVSVGTAEAEAMNREIQERQKLLDVVPEPVRSRIMSLKAYPNEIVKRINQVNGVIVEFEERL